MLIDNRMFSVYTAVYKIYIIFMDSAQQSIYQVSYPTSLKLSRLCFFYELLYSCLLFYRIIQNYIGKVLQPYKLAEMSQWCVKCKTKLISQVFNLNYFPPDKLSHIVSPKQPTIKQYVCQRSQWVMYVGINEQFFFSTLMLNKKKRTYVCIITMLMQRTSPAVILYFNSIPPP